MATLTIRQMLYFEALAQTLHFGRAAQLAGVSQPALSSQIAELEERLACKLFDRGGRGVTMTDEARTLLPRIERILADIRDVEASTRQQRQPMEGRFKLGVIPTVAPYILPIVLPELKARFPDLTLELRESGTASLVEDTASGKLDGFIAALPLDYPGLATEVLFADRFFLAVPADDPGFGSPPVLPESPALRRLMLLEEGHCLRDQALAICGSVRPVAMANYGATSLTTLLQMVSHGLGVTLIPEMALSAADATAGLRVVPFAEPMPERTICLAWRRNGARQQECRDLAGIMRELRPRLLPRRRRPEPARHSRSGGSAPDMPATSR